MEQKDIELRLEKLKNELESTFMMSNTAFSQFNKLKKEADEALNDGEMDLYREKMLQMTSTAKFVMLSSKRMETIKADARATYVGLFGPMGGLYFDHLMKGYGV